MSREYTVSEATLHSADLVEAFHAELKRLNPDVAADVEAQYADVFAGLENDRDFDTEDLVEILMYAIESNAPDGMWFGVHEGNGSLFMMFEIQEEDESNG